jgi:hypothetical protein
MITHNGTYLLHATHHGMPIVAATMGGKMVIGVSLLHATKQAIVAAFGSAEGTEVIRKTNDYLNRIAQTDPARALQISGFINTYAVEDAHIVYSLVPTLGVVRLLMGDGRAYINTGKSLTDGFRAKFKLKFNDNRRNAGFVGTHGTSSPWKRNFIGCSDGNKAEVAYGDYYPFGNNTFEVGTIYDIDASTAKIGTYFKVNGEYAITERTHSQALSEITVKLFAMGYNIGSGSNESKSGMDGIELFGADNTTRIAYYVTFIRNGVNGMLDLLTDDFFPNANSVGSFTISETPTP